MEYAITITHSDLEDIAGVSPQLSKKYADSLNVAMEQYGIRGVRPQAHFLAQVLHESGRLRYNSEIWGPTLAQQRYDVRGDLGNTTKRDGDGYRYRGRGLIQLTGRGNYERFAKHLQRFYGNGAPDVVEKPDEVAEPPLAAIVAGWFWKSRGLSEIVEKTPNENRAVRRVTRRINGGYNGLNDRETLYHQALPVLRQRQKEAFCEPVPVLAPEFAGVEVNIGPIPPK